MSATPPHAGPTPNRTRDALGLAVLLALCFGAAALGGLMTYPNIAGWYEALNKPAWNPPNAVFGPVWTALYAMMAVAAWLVWREPGRTFAPLAMFAVQLVLNVAWSGLFFALRSPGIAFVDIIALWLAIAATAAAFWRVRPVAGALLLPYLAWVTFAAALNFTIWRLNA